MAENLELKDLQLYISSWKDKMLEIWQEKIIRLKVMDTGRLYNSFEAKIARLNEGTDIKFHFLQYGIYQARGTGYGYKHGNGGNLEFLDPEYRRAHHLDKPYPRGPVWGGGTTSGNPRERRDWYEGRLYASYRRLVEAAATITGEEAAQVVCDALDPD